MAVKTKVKMKFHDKGGNATLDIAVVAIMMTMRVRE
jgi:hypothetical protein